MKTPDSTDRLYRDWHNSRKAVLTPLGELQARIVARVCAEDVRRARPATVWMPRWAWAAALPLVLAGGLALWHLRAPTPEDPAVVQPTTTHAAQAELFQGLEDLFGPGLEWAAQEKGELRLGVAPVARDAEDRAPPVLVRIEIARPTESGKWSVVWTSDVLLRGGHFADLAPAGLANARINLWVMPQPDGSFVYDTVFHPDLTTGGAHLAGVTEAGTRVVVPGGSASTPGYKLTQTILPMQDIAG
jgi:hypothetical protein